MDYPYCLKHKAKRDWILTRTATELAQRKKILKLLITYFFLYLFAPLYASFEAPNLFLFLIIELFINQLKSLIFFVH